MTTLAQIKSIKTKWDEPNVLPSRGWLLAEIIGTDLEPLTSCPVVSGDLAVGFYVDYPQIKEGPTILAKAYLRLRDYSWNLFMDDHTYCRTVEEARAWILDRVNKALKTSPVTEHCTLEG